MKITVLDAYSINPGDCPGIPLPLSEILLLTTGRILQKFPPV